MNNLVLIKPCRNILFSFTFLSQSEKNSTWNAMINNTKPNKNCNKTKLVYYLKHLNSCK